MATLKINGLTKEQSNTLAIGFEQYDSFLLDGINKYLKKMNVCEIQEIQQVYFDQFREGDNEVEL